MLKYQGDMTSWKGLRFVNTANSANITDNKSEISEMQLSDEKKKETKADGKRNLLLMTLLSLLIMFSAVGLIYYFIQSDPELVHKNDQTTAVSESEGFVNPDSIQKLEHDTKNITLKPVENSTAFIICGGVFMVVMVGAFVFVKVAEHKEDN